jgi:hypothetical protein
MAYLMATIESLVKKGLKKLWYLRCTDVAPMTCPAVIPIVNRKLGAVMWS